jgi:hypothetical protein
MNKVYLVTVILVIFLIVFLIYLLYKSFIRVGKLILGNAIANSKPISSVCALTNSKDWLHPDMNATISVLKDEGFVTYYSIPFARSLINDVNKNQYNFDADSLRKRKIKSMEFIPGSLKINPRNYRVEEEESVNLSYYSLEGKMMQNIKNGVYPQIESPQNIDVYLIFC